MILFVDIYETILREKALVAPFPADAMRARPITPRVNSPKNNDPEIMTPIAALHSDGRWEMENDDRRENDALKFD
jgi:hypothetical protein